MNLLTESKPAVQTILAPETAIQLDDVSVRYRVPGEQINTFKEYMIRWMQGKVKKHDFWALHHIDLTLQKGEVFGLVGRNGAGKSTLLKVVAKVLRPTQGRVRVVGHVVPLLELGAGFHPELTGRENIYLNGSMLGYTRAQMNEKFKRIIEFSELGEFIDSPLRTYSSGMWARLGFAIAVDDQPDILIVDEVLGVGDEAFQRKCALRINEYHKQGATILIVSHNAALIQSVCQRAALLERGVIRAVGTPDEVLDLYHQQS